MSRGKKDPLMTALQAARKEITKLRTRAYQVLDETDAVDDAISNAIYKRTNEVMDREVASLSLTKARRK